jgi:hypothetical protein
LKGVKKRNRESGISEEWNIGIMEHWNNGKNHRESGQVISFLRSPIFQYSSIPLFQRFLREDLNEVFVFSGLYRSLYVLGVWAIDRCGV